jgi:anaerobic selenocysteine-containing dehydrogenase
MYAQAVPGMRCGSPRCSTAGSTSRTSGVGGDPDSPDSRGFLRIRGHASHELLDNEHRVLYPMMRAPRGDAWRRARNHVCVRRTLVPSWCQR